MKISLHEIWRRITSTRYTRALESELASQAAEITRQRAEIARRAAENDRQRAAIASQQNEIARLRAKNRALLNSILGIAGIPPIPPDAPQGNPHLLLADEPETSGALLPSSVSLPTKCHSESAAADAESRSTPPHSSLTAAEKNSPGAQRPRNDIPPQSSSPPSTASRHRLATRAERDSVEGRSFISDITDGREAPSSVEGQGFSPDINDGREAPSSLPKAVAESQRTQRQGFSSHPQSPPRRPLPAPMRRRSWHQIMRTLEFESGKKKSPTD